MSMDYITEDMEDAASDSNIPWDMLRDSTVLVTGATGLIGSALVRALYAANERYGLGIDIIAHGRDVSKGMQLIDNYGVTFFRHDILEPIYLSGNAGYIFHTASVTCSEDMVRRPADVIFTAVAGTRNVLELAAQKQAKGVVYLSSMEVYGRFDGVAAENDLGYLDLANPRSSYPESKRLCEQLCNAYCAQYGVPVKSVRLAQTFGAGSPKDDTRVFAQFARSAAAGEDIILHTEGASMGNYCYISDAARAILTVLLKGEDGQAYNAANPAASMTIREMAGLAAGEFGVNAVVKIPEDLLKYGYAPATGLKLNTDKISALGWEPKYGLIDMYRRMIDSWGSL